MIAHNATENTLPSAGDSETLETHPSTVGTSPNTSGAMITLRAAALSYAARGWPVLPLYAPRADHKCTCSRVDCDSVGKHPRVQHGVKDATLDPDIINKWWAMWPTANIGIATGLVSGFFVVDVDPRNGGDVTLHGLEKQFAPLPATVTAHTGGGGSHILFACPAIVEKLPAQLGPGIDLKGNGGYIVAPPSLHASGIHYRWVLGHDPGAMKLAEFPDWLLSLAPPSSTAADSQAGPGIITQGDRNKRLFRHACWLRREGFDRPAIEETLIAVNNATCSPPLAHSEIRHIVTSAVRYAPADPHKTGLDIQRYTDLGNASVFCEQYRNAFRHCATEGGWLRWDGHRWERDQTRAVNRAAIATIRELGNVLPALSSQAERQRLQGHARRSASAPRLRGLVSIAESMLAVRSDELDADATLLNVRNGTIDLTSFQLRKHNPKDLITRKVLAEFDPTAPAPRWEHFLDEITAGDTQLQDFLRRVAGYSLTGDASEQVFFIATGAGANGKSTFLGTLQHILNDYAQQIPAAALTADGASRHLNAIARIKGARVVVASELERGQRLAETTIKQLTGGDKFAARLLYREFIEFTPTAKLFVVTNELPLLQGGGDAIWRRVCVIPFRVTIPPAKRDPTLPKVLLEESSGILAWALRGCAEWSQRRLDPPEAVREASADYYRRTDPLSAFVSECCVLDPTARVAAGDFYDALNQWIDAHGKPPPSQRDVAARLTALGMQQKRGTGGLREWRGLRLRE